MKNLLALSLLAVSSCAIASETGTHDFNLKRPGVHSRAASIHLPTPDFTKKASKKSAIWIPMAPAKGKNNQSRAEALVKKNPTAYKIVNGQLYLNRPALERQWEGKRQVKIAQRAFGNLTIRQGTSRRSHKRTNDGPINTWTKHRSHKNK